MIEELEVPERAPGPAQAGPPPAARGPSHPADGAPKAATTMFSAVAFMSSPLASVALTLQTSVRERSRVAATAVL
ncbi:hypothetical protein [Streptomyces sp. NBC_00846]|uniref:hypothetical protein n=1 Tax=Streptomyces sp. NBC_00846 TaxID=2975849 RepID=UPI00386FD033